MSFLALIFSLMSVSMAGGWKDLPDFSCTQQKDSICYQQAKEVVAKNFSPYSVEHFQFFRDPKHIPMYSEQGKGAGRYLLQNRQSEFVFVFIHGLYSDDMQFATTAAYLFYNNQNVVHLVLPGHGADWQRAPTVQISDWIDYVKRAAKVTRPLGRRLILVGQSTGGLLAILLAMSREPIVDGLILMEPALKVQSGKESIVCLARIFGNFAQDIPNLAKIFGYDVNRIPKSVSPQMGCRVVQMREEILKQFEVVDDPQDSTKASVALSRRISVPTLLLSPQHDSVVRQEDNFAFIKALENRNLGMYFEYPDSRVDHGVFNLTSPVLFHSQVENYLSRYFDWQKVVAQNISEARFVENLMYLESSILIAMQLQEKYQELEKKPDFDQKIRDYLLEASASNARHKERMKYISAFGFRNEFRLRDLRPMIDYLPQNLQTEVRDFVNAYMDLILLVDKNESLAFSDRIKLKMGLDRELRLIPKAVSENLRSLNLKIKELHEQH